MTYIIHCLLASKHMIQYDPIWSKTCVYQPYPNENAQFCLCKTPNSFLSNKNPKSLRNEIPRKFKSDDPNLKAPLHCNCCSTTGATSDSFAPYLACHNYTLRDASRMHSHHPSPNILPLSDETSCHVRHMSWFLDLVCSSGPIWTDSKDLSAAANGKLYGLPSLSAQHKPCKTQSHTKY